MATDEREKLIDEICIALAAFRIDMQICPHRNMVEESGKSDCRYPSGYWNGGADDA